jgi:hypothetical protein
MTYADSYNIRTTSVKFNDIADALDGLITRYFGGTTTGTSTAYVATATPAWASYATGSMIVIIPHVANAAGSPSVTINVNGLGTKAIKRGGSDLLANTLSASVPSILFYTGTYFEVIAPYAALLIDGTNTMIANLNLGGYRPVNIAAGTATAPGVCLNNDSNTGVFAPAADTWAVATGGSERFRVDSTGRILVGTTSSAGTAGSITYLKDSGGTTWQVGPGTNGSGNQYWVVNGSDVGVRLSSGTTSWATVSDQRQKKNIQTLEYGLSEIDNLRAVRFDYVTDESDSSSRIGFIAQEVLPHIPEAVSGSEESYYGVAATEIIPVLVGAVKELNAKVEALEARLAQVENVNL